jgi:hypothetical protein
MVENCAGFVGLDHGNHCPKIRHFRCEFCEPLQHIGILHYHFRNPLETARRAIVDLVGLGDLSANATIENIAMYERNLTKILSNDRPGQHKAKELLRFVHDGVSGLLNAIYDVYPKQGKIIQVGTIQELVECIKST